MAFVLKDFIQLGELPAEGGEILPQITNADGTYLFQEGQIWDFKEAWPFSYSDEYFLGIARLICAFSNTEGGLIIFGVDDKTRKGGRTKVAPNLDRLEQALDQLTNAKPALVLRRYESADCGDVDILLVKQKPKFAVPLRFSRDVGKHKAGRIWVRRGSEVRDADSRDVPGLYLRTSFDGALSHSPLGHLPPSPSTLREFVGRMTTIDRVFDWLLNQDDPRSFLFGKGGSGKSTIAYEVFKHLRNDGSELRIDSTEILQQVIYVSGKQTFLNVENQKPQEFIGNDFSDEKTLYSAILLLRGIDADELPDRTLDGIKKAIKGFFDENSCFVIIDDVDTLTTAGKEAGIDFLYGVLWRAKKRSKLLYTVRNRPTHSLNSSIEVPGLSGDEYHEFIRVCCKQFNVHEPERAFADGKLHSVSEGRPLVIESIVALRRHAGSYPNALALFEKGSGDDVRRYVFEREWNALDAADRGREVLALLALSERPVAFTDLVAMSRLEETKLKDAIAAIQEIFLVTDDNGLESSYSLASLTKAFVTDAAQSLDLFGTIKARVDFFKKTFYPESPELSRLYQKLHRAQYDLKHDDDERMTGLWRELQAAKFPPLVTENPRYIALRAYVALLKSSPALDQARQDFGVCFEVGFEPEIDYLRVWFEAERQSDMGDQQTKAILAKVMGSKSYLLSTKTDFKSRRASYLYGLARETASVEPTRALDRLEEALTLHLESFKDLSRIRGSNTRRSNEYGRNTAFYLIQRLSDYRDYDRLIDLIGALTREERVYLDPIAEPIIFLFQSMQRSYSNVRGDLQRASGKLEKFVRAVEKSSLWCMHDTRDALLSQLGHQKVLLKNAIGLATR